MQIINWMTHSRAACAKAITFSKDYGKKANIHGDLQKMHSGYIPAYLKFKDVL